jgi:hypothetical protein
MRRLTVLLFLVVSPLWGNEVKLPPEVRAGPGRLVKLTATTDGKTVRWICGSPDADLIASESGLWAIFSAAQPGRFLVYAYTAQGDVPSEPARCVVIVEGPAPPPGPAPVPPPPPDPPLDPLVGKLSVAYALETDPQKATLKTSLAGVYRQGAAMARDNANLQTCGDVFRALSAAASSARVNGKIMEVQKVVQLELQGKLPVDPKAALDRTLASSVFLSVASALEKAK